MYAICFTNLFGASDSQVYVADDCTCVVADDQLSETTMGLDGADVQKQTWKSRCGTADVNQAEMKFQSSLQVCDAIAATHK